MRVLVTGGAGFIGSHVVAQLLRTPSVKAVRVVDNLCTGHSHNLKPFASKIEFIKGDLLNDSVRSHAVKDIDVILHQAAIPSVPRSIADPIENHLNGAHLAVLLMDSARKAGVKRIVLAGTAAVYGENSIVPKSEQMAPEPISPYAATKLAAEYYAAAFSKSYGLETITLRYFNVFGPRQDPKSQYSGVIARFCHAYCRNETLTIFGDGGQSRDFVYVENVANANVRASLAIGPFNGDVVNIGCGKATTLNELISLLNELTRRTVRPAYAHARAGDVRVSVADISKASVLIGYTPVVSLTDGLRQTYEWYQSEADGSRADD